MSSMFDQAILLKMSEILGDKWAIPIVGELMTGRKRFNEIQQALKINPRTLSNRLKRLEESAFITRNVFAEVPPRVEYALTEKGQDLSSILDAIVKFGEMHLD